MATTRRSGGAIAALAVLLAAPAAAQSSDPAWLDALNDQLLAEKECEVVYYIRMEEREIGGQTTYEARVQCSDGRQFDAWRMTPEPDFELRRCEVELC